MKYFKALTAILILSCATVGAVYSIMPINGPIIGINTLTECTAPTDSIRLRLVVGSVLDRRGDPVASIIYGINTNGNRIITDTVPANPNASTNIENSLICPAYNDSLIINAVARMIDNRGVVGDEGVSSDLIIKTIDNRGPIAPIISIDTIAGIQYDSISIYAVGTSEKIINHFKLTGELGDGYSIQLCPVIWLNNVGTVPSDYVNECVSPSGHLIPNAIHYNTQRYGE